MRTGPPEEPFTAALSRDHPLDCRLGESSSLGRLGIVGARVLLLGVGFESYTAFHLGE